MTLAKKISAPNTKKVRAFSFGGAAPHLLWGRGGGAGGALAFIQ